MKYLLCLGLLLAATAMPAMLGFATSGVSVILDNRDPVLALISPNGGEVWYAGETYNITWTATDWWLPPTAVQISYSADGGNSFEMVADGIANTGSYAWPLPLIDTAEALVRIRATDSQGNFSQQDSAIPFTITFVPPQAPQLVTASIVSGGDAVISWEPVTQTVTGVPLVPDGYLVFHSPDAGDESQFTLLANIVTGCSYTHSGAAQNYPRSFYRVVAYKDYDGRVAALIKAPQAPTLADLRTLSGGRP